MMNELFDKEQNYYAEIIIPLALPKNYTWCIPQQYVSVLLPGMRVEVELRKKRYAGIVKKIHTDKPSGFEPRPIQNVLDTEPLITLHQLKLWQWMAQYYMCSEGEVMQAALPSHLKLSSETIIVWNEMHNEDFSALDNREYIIAEALSIRKQLNLSEVQQLLDTHQVYPVIKELIARQVCFVWEELKEKYKEKTDNYVLLHPDYHLEDNLEKLLNNSTRAPKQMQLLLSFLHLIKTDGEVTQAALLKKADASAAQLKGLADKGILRIEKKAVSRLKTLAPAIEIDFKLSAAQHQAAVEIEKEWETKNVCLLHGITGSGKTQIYIQFIEKIIRTNAQALYMLPEIALTSQLIRRLQKHFGGYIAVYHSRFNPQERVELWNRVKSGEIKVLLGARSSLFLPFQNLQLIIADEEHDSSYKQQDPAPRYHARDAAIFYATLLKAKVLLGSATPAIETYYNAKQQKFGYVALTERFGAATLPEIIITEKPLSKKGADNFIGPQMLQALQDCVQEKKQAIVFQNRRGYVPYISCEGCGWIPQCRNCDVTLTYHKIKHSLICHYCGSDYPVLNICPICGKEKFAVRNFGTEKLEERLSELLPGIQVARMDLDTTRGKHQHDQLIKAFEQQRIQILAGTQMIVKGLDFEHVQLVAIPDADNLLFHTDFRVNERAFQLMEQVSGRAGRTNNKGKVLIQVSQAKHPVLQFLQTHDYESFYNWELEIRKRHLYPPFVRLVHITIKHREKHIAEEAAHLLVRGLDAFKNQVTGPAQPPVGRVRNRYIWQLMIKLPKEVQRIAALKETMQEQMGILLFNKRYNSVRFELDVDPN